MTTRFRDLDNITHDLEYSWTNVSVTGWFAERDEAGVGDLGMFDSVWCIRERRGGITVNCVNLPHSLSFSP